ncbi:type I restriction endonuclease [Carboxydothermus pertinax]|uniref:DNA polymerase III subunit epsilon n=1 Tax=Carboxydothermus pertinax TaxID=870242 RepID=A0A1L8CRM2_9THEO|nr:type I restriction endonuclease [Carboxydothermus pertinax]GAV21571.1 DNA polymerase III subunit epsilon [Carboxydothermus pertinax]
MSFKDDLLKLSMQISERKVHVNNEETTKHALIIPFIQILGYDVFNPLEVKPEYTADFGKKKGEKVDYAIFKNNKPIMFIEAKSVTEKLENHDTQLSRYFNSTPEVKIAILTNGIIYKFFTDLNQNNVMDPTPFYEFDLENLKESDYEAIAKFRKEVFDQDNLVKYAEDLVYMANLNKNLKELFKNPSDEFIRFLIKDFSDTRITANVIERFRPVVKKAIQATLVEIISQGILKEDDETIAQLPEPSIPENNDTEERQRKIETNDEELYAFEKIKEILLKANKDISQINYKDTVNYFGIYKRNINGWFLRINLTSTIKYIASRLPIDETKKVVFGYEVQEAPKGLGESRVIINQKEDIENLKDYIIKCFEIVENF